MTGRPTSTRPAAAGWSPPPLIDPLIVLRSARALDRYGPDFRYAHYVVVKRLPTLAVLGAGAGALVRWRRSSRPATCC